MNRGSLPAILDWTFRRKPVATAKFYLFDVGVANALKRTGTIEPGSVWKGILPVSTFLKGLWSGSWL